MSSTKIYIWIRSSRLLSHFIESPPRLARFATIFAICRELANHQKISRDTFLATCERRGVATPLADAIYESRSDDNNVAIIVALLFAAIQASRDEKVSRGERILANCREFFAADTRIFGFLRDLRILDEFFEGTVKLGGVGKSCVRPVTEILTIFEEQNEKEIFSRILSHLILDPYRIDDLPFDRFSSSSSNFRRTTLAHNSRRIVHFHNINRIELLRRETYANTHLRICHDTPKASFLFALQSHETAILDNLEFCQTTVLGAVRGAVIIANCKSMRISVACRQLHLVNCQQLQVYCMSARRATVTRCDAVELAPLNVTYMEHARFLNECELDFEMNREVKKPIILDDSTWKFMDPTKFMCQLTPVQTSQNDIELLVSSLPEVYRLAAHSNTIAARKLLNSSSSNILRLAHVISHRDLIYLKSKREQNEEKEVEEESVL